MDEFSEYVHKQLLEDARKRVSATLGTVGTISSIETKPDQAHGDIEKERVVSN